MGRYTTAGDMRKLFKAFDTVPQITDIDLEFFVTMSEAEIDGYLAQQYTLPFSLVPPVIRSLASEYATIKALDRFFTGETENKNDWRMIRKKELTELLKGYADGSLTLTSSDSSIIAQRADLHNIVSGTSRYTPTHGHGDVVFEEVDPGRREDEEDARDH